MKTDEIKLRIANFLENTIDLYLPLDSVSNKLLNATAKLWVSQNLYKIGDILSAFGDKNDDIDTEKVKHIYEEALFENGNFNIDIKAILPDSMGFIKQILPDKIIAFTKDDLYKIFE